MKRRIISRYFFCRLWQRVTVAIKQNDQISATEEKTIIEDEQRRQIKERKNTGTEWHPRLFNIDSNTKEWIYTYAESVHRSLTLKSSFFSLFFSARPWDAHNDISTYENNFVICTRTRHRALHMIHSNQSSNRNNSTLNLVTQSSTLNRGPSPSLNNIREDEPASTTPTNCNPTNTFAKSNDDFISMLKRIEATLVRTNERLDAHEKRFSSLQNHSPTTEFNQFGLLSPYIHYVLIIIVAITLKYIFQ